jgi:hypothetical protein
MKMCVSTTSHRQEILVIEILCTEIPCPDAGSLQDLSDIVEEPRKKDFLLRGEFHMQLLFIFWRDKPNKNRQIPSTKATLPALSGKAHGPAKKPP